MDILDGHATPRLQMIQTRRDISRTVGLSANRKSYMPRRLSQQRMTFSDLKWPFHALCAISAVAERFVLILLSVINCKHAIVIMPLLIS